MAFFTSRSVSRTCAWNLSANTLPVRRATRFRARANADREPLQGAREDRRLIGFHDQMQVHSLDRVVDDAHPDPAFAARSASSIARFRVKPRRKPTPGSSRMLM